MEGTKFFILGYKVSFKALPSRVGLFGIVRLTVCPIVYFIVQKLVFICKTLLNFGVLLSCLFFLARLFFKKWLDNLQDLIVFPICKDSYFVKCIFSVAAFANNRKFFVYRVESRQRLYSL